MFNRLPRNPSPVLPATVRKVLAVTALMALVALFTRCAGDTPQERTATSTITRAIRGAPDELPALANDELPFRYPAALYERRVQGNVTLRLFVDSSGTAIQDSTRVEESSGHAELDSAAMRGSRDLRFTPARRRGTAIPVSLLYPVYFRHPEAEPLPGDTVLELRRP